MVVAFAAVAALLAVAFVATLSRARREWRTGAKLSGATAALITLTWLATAALLALAVAGRPLAIDAPATAAAIVGIALALAGIVLAAPAYLPFASVEELYGVDRGDGLITGGVFAYSRNPQYTGIGLALLGVAVAARSGLALAVVAAYWAGIRVWLVAEEAHLERLFGPEYAAYRERAPRFLALTRYRRTDGRAAAAAAGRRRRSSPRSDPGSPPGR